MNNHKINPFGWPLPDNPPEHDKIPYTKNDSETCNETKTNKVKDEPKIQEDSKNT